MDHCQPAAGDVCCQEANGRCYCTQQCNAGDTKVGACSADNVAFALCPAAQTVAFCAPFSGFSDGG